MESEPEGPYCGRDDEVSRQREKRATDLLARLVPRTEEAADSITGTDLAPSPPARRAGLSGGRPKGDAAPTAQAPAPDLSGVRGQRRGGNC
jgi:hypothetical protein